MTAGPVREGTEFGGPLAPADWGAALRPLWALQDGITYLNHGAYGATPHEVLRIQSEIRMRLEAQPCRFMADELPAALRSAAARLAQFVGVQDRDLVFVENATAGINAVLGSMDFADGDEVLISDHTYPAVRNALCHRLRGTGARLVTAGLGLPVSGPEQILSAFRQAVTARTRLAVIDHVGRIAESHERVMVCLDSNHTHEHVLNELNAYAPMVTPGSYCIVYDTGIEDLPAGFCSDRPWDKGDNPKTAVWAFLAKHTAFRVDKSWESKLGITSAPDGFLVRTE